MYIVYRNPFIFNSSLIFLLLSNSAKDVPNKKVPNQLSFYFPRIHHHVEFLIFYSQLIIKTAQKQWKYDTYGYDL